MACSINRFPRVDRPGEHVVRKPGERAERRGRPLEGLHPDQDTEDFGRRDR